jgi:hypothetical protein
MEYNKEKRLYGFRKLSFKKILKSYKSHKWIRHGLSWGVFMYLSTVFLFPLLRGKKITMMAVLIGIPLWIIGGLAFGYSMNNSKTDEPEEDLENE